MSGKKAGKEIHVDHLTIHANDVKIIRERSREHDEERRHPLDFFGPRRRREQEMDEEHHRKDESSSDEGNEERRRGFRWF
ncbi:hypothetical protein QNH36_07570 [Mesobacillus sp. AQ2]|jgi:hypothetical protein|uniref:hypothetical protein n=1 Tax=Bacillaceae TaxID=186817 RepID=UPI0011A885B9|nr:MULTISPECIES: hypothetical protein [Bacillaceae]MCM3124794.1 hypothetical protein [Mesobacillus sp. MER 33]MCM3232897.1 hypothetical protein [Mesobacillus sp. MER 48]WHX41983.1 hypothetical protein QNH36_07570 [Mesobacillus sp. AQ2]